MSRATDAYMRLTQVMRDTDPACKGDERFILDYDEKGTHQTRTPGGEQSVSAICRSCPLFDLCAEYAELERPKAGVWAGKRYRTNVRKTA
jgi:hypothetical protein